MQVGNHGRQLVLKASTCLVLLTVAGGSAETRSGQRWALSIKPVALSAHERICGFEIRLTSARVVGLNDVPLGWHVVIDNDPAWMPTIKGSIIVGAAALDADAFSDFAIIEMEPRESGLPEPPRFKADGELVTTIDFAKEERRITLAADNFQLARVEGRPCAGGARSGAVFGPPRATSQLR